MSSVTKSSSSPELYYFGLWQCQNLGMVAMFPACWLIISLIGNADHRLNIHAQRHTHGSPWPWLAVKVMSQSSMQNKNIMDWQTQFVSLVTWKEKFFFQSSTHPLQYISLKLLILFQVICKSWYHPEFWIAIASVYCCGHHILLWHFKQVISVFLTHTEQNWIKCLCWMETT